MYLLPRAGVCFSGERLAAGIELYKRCSRGISRGITYLGRALFALVPVRAAAKATKGQ